MSENRIHALDTAKAIGITLVFYGHLVEQVAITDPGNTAAIAQQRFNYSFHVPLFFFLAGCFWKRRGDSFTAELARLARRRLLPVFTFGVMLLPIWPAYQYFTTGAIDRHDLFWRVLDYFHGEPRLNWITWFLVCLFTAEVYAWIVMGAKPTAKRALIAAAVSMAFGIAAARSPMAVDRIFGIHYNAWFIHEAFVALGFYLAGFAAAGRVRGLLAAPLGVRLAAMVLMLVVTVACAELNRPTTDFVVKMTISSHGQPALFVLAAMAGTAAAMLAASLLPDVKAFAFVGRNTLYLLGLNGAFLHFINPLVVERFPASSDPVGLTVYCLLGTIMSLALCAPLCDLFDRYLPHLFGGSRKPLAA